MIEFLILLLFFIYSMAIFLINNIYILLFVFIFNLIISLIFKVPLNKHIKVIKNNIIFVIFIVLCNILFSDINSSLKVGIRLFLAIDFTYIIGVYFNPTKIRIAFKYFFFPLKLFKIDIDSLTLIIAISIAFIPILIDELTMIKLSLRSKGIDFKFISIITKPHIYLMTFLNNLFDRLDELEKTLIIKAY